MVLYDGLDTAVNLHNALPVRLYLTWLLVLQVHKWLTEYASLHNLVSLRFLSFTLSYPSLPLLEPAPLNIFLFYPCFVSLFLIPGSLPSQCVYVTWALAWQVRKWLCLNAGRQAAQGSTSSFNSKVLLPTFHLRLLSVSLTYIHYLSSVSIQSHAPLYKNYKTVFNLNIRLPSPVLATWMATEDRVLLAFVASFFPLLLLWRIISPKIKFPGIIRPYSNSKKKKKNTLNIKMTKKVSENCISKNIQYNYYNYSMNTSMIYSENCRRLFYN